MYFGCYNKTCSLFAKYCPNAEVCILSIIIIHEKSAVCDMILQFLGRKLLFFQNGMRYNTSMK